MSKLVRKLSLAVLVALGSVGLVFAMGSTKTVDNAKTATVEIDTAVGKAKVPVNPQKVVVLDVGVLDNLNLLGVNDKVGMVPEFRVVRDLDIDLSNKKPAGTLFEPDYEAIAKYKPDLIIVATRSAKKLGDLSKIATTIDMSLDNDNFISSAKDRVLAYGKIFNKEDQAKKVIAKLDAKLAEAKQATKGKGNGLLIMVNGNKLAATGTGGRFGWLYTDLGIPVAVENISTDRHGQPISFEFIKEKNPQWLLIFDRFVAIGKEGPRATDTFDNAIMKDTTAWKNQQVVYIDQAAYIQPGGLTGIIRNTDAVIAAFNKK